MSEAREVDDALIRRIVAAAADAGVSRAGVELEWPECHKPKCQHRHGSPDIAMGYMKHQIIQAIESELRFEATTRPDLSHPGDTPEEAAAFTLGVLMSRYRVAKTGTYAKAARLIVEAYPELVPALSASAAEVRSTDTTAQTVQGRPVGGDPSFGQKITLTTNHERNKS